MNKIPVIGGIKAEIKLEMEENVVEINIEDIISSDRDNDGDNEVNKDGNIVHVNGMFDEHGNVTCDYTNIPKNTTLKPEKELLNKHMKIWKNKKENKYILVNVTEVQQNNNNDKCSKDFKPQDSEQIQEKLILNYNLKYKDVHNDSHKKTLQKRNTVNEITSWSNLNPTREATSVHEDMLKVKVTRVPASFVEATEYTKKAIHQFRCNHCQFFTTLWTSCKKHIRQQHRNITKKYSCPYCPVVSKYCLKTHIISMHTPESELTWFRCNECNFKSKLKNTLSSHLLTHLDPSQMLDRMKKCDRCPKMYKTGCALRRHQLCTHENKKFKKLKCKYPQCNYEAHNLSNHIAVCHSNHDDLETLKCPHCIYKTRIKYRLKDHIKAKHIEKMFQCEKCLYRTTTMELLRLHLISHKETKDEADLKYRCDKCDYKTYRFYNFQVHKLNHLKPEEINFFYCYHCNFKAKRKDNLKTHVLRHFKHNEVSFACFICDFTTTKKHLLIKHINKHSTETRNKIKNEKEVKDATTSKFRAKKRKGHLNKYLIETKNEMKNDEELEDTMPGGVGAKKKKIVRTNKVIVPPARRSKRNKNKTRKGISPTIMQSKKK